MSGHRTVDLRGPLKGVRYEVRDRIAFVTLDRPQRGNSLTPGMQAVFRAIWSEVREDPEIRVAILTAPAALAGVAVLRYSVQRVMDSAPDNVQELRERGLLP